MKAPYFIGQSRYTIDPKSRLFIPSRFREALKEETEKYFILTSGIDGCLYLFLPSRWSNLLETNLQGINLSNKDEERAFKRKFFSEANEVEPDAQGRILIPQFLRAYAEIKKNVVVQGVASRIEIWDERKWNAYYKSKVLPSFKKLSKNLEI